MLNLVGAVLGSWLARVVCTIAICDFVFLFDVAADLNKPSDLDSKRRATQGKLTEAPESGIVCSLPPDLALPGVGSSSARVARLRVHRGAATVAARAAWGAGRAVRAIERTRAVENVIVKP